jgi:transcriptional regulator with XRE-family HTH domain
MTKKTTKAAARPSKLPAKAMARGAAKLPPIKQAPTLGDCLRAIRAKRGMTLADVSAVSGLARSTLSRVESGQLSLTYDKLVQLSHGLRIDLAELLSSPNAPAPNAALTRRTFTPTGSGKTLTVGDTVYRYMCTEMSAKRMTPMVADIHARTLEESNGLLAHPGEEFTYVLAGTVELHTEFYEPLLLEAGACVYFDSTMRHTYLAPSGAPGKILCVCSVDTTTAPHGTSRTQEK